MAKTPESVTGGSAPTMRYRRKAPTTAAPTPTVASDSCQRDDNQTEHREAEAAHHPTQEETGKQQSTAPRNNSDKETMNPVSTRKKKPKAVEPNTVEEPTSTAEPKAHAVAKKKLKKRQLASTQCVDNRNADDPAAETPTTPTNGTSTAASKSMRKRKPSANANGPSLLKQLLWKAKPVSSPSVPPGAAPTVDTRPRDGEEEEDNDDGDGEEAEEMAYTVSERYSRKLLAAKRVAPVHPLGGEMSSQETQSGSDEEEGTYHSYQNLVPPEAIEPTDLLSSTATAACIDTFFPASFPVALASDAARLQEHGVTVHHVLIEDFAFHPQQVRVLPSDVVVWSVSDRTLAMVEHSLEITVQRLQTRKQRVATRDQPPVVGKTTTPPLGSGAQFALRFSTAAYVSVACSVYQTKGSVVVNKPKAKKEKVQKTTTGDDVDAVERPATVTKKPKWKRKAERRAAMRQEAHQQHSSQLVEEEDADDEELDGGRDSVDSAVFHPPADLMQATEMDAGVCREVLTQLEEVVAAAIAPVILIGDVECPVLADEWISNQDDPAASHELLSPETKAAALADELSGTDEDDEDDGDEDDEHEVGGAMEDFQQRVIGMLRRSEEARAQHRRSFQHEASGFDAGAAYDFFKRRFMQAQEDRAIVYSVCPEPQRGAGVGVTEVASLLAQPTQ